MASLPPRVTSPSHWLIGPAYYAQRDPLRWIRTWIEDYGDICMVRAPLGAATIVADPQLAREVLADRYARYQKKSLSYHVLRVLMGNGLVTSEGEFWRGQRKLVQPAFHRRRLQALFSMMLERVQHCADRLLASADKTKAIDLAPVLSELTLDIISRAMFSTDLLGSGADVSRHIAILNEYALHMLRHPWHFLLPRSVPTFFNATPVRSLRALNAIVRGIILARRRNPGAHDDLLSMLLTACEEETGRGMTDDQLRDEVMTIFIAGHETTANAMSWLLYLVSQHPEVETRLLREIDAVSAGEALTMESLSRHTYVRQVIDESLRVFPTIWSVGRRCSEPDHLGGFEIPVGMNMLIPIFYFHRSPRYWPEPERFDPDRFSPERRPAADSPIYFPFGAGPRSCIGNHFALQELMITTIVLLQHFRFSVEPGFHVEAEPLITLRPKNGMRMLLQRGASSVPGTSVRGPSDERRSSDQTAAALDEWRGSGRDNVAIP